MQDFTKKTNIKEFVPKQKDHSFRYGVGTLLKPNNTETFNKHGFCIVVKHENNGIPSYVFYSQKEQREWEMKCWVVNAFWIMEAESAETPST